MSWKLDEKRNLERNLKKYKLKSQKGKEGDCCKHHSEGGSMINGVCHDAQCPLLHRKKELETRWLQDRLLTEEVVSQLQVLKNKGLKVPNSNTALRKAGRKFQNCVRKMNYVDLCNKGEFIVYDRWNMLMFKVLSVGTIKDGPDLQDVISKTKTHNYYERRKKRHLYVIEARCPKNESTHPAYYSNIIQSVLSILDNNIIFVPNKDMDEHYYF